MIERLIHLKAAAAMVCIAFLLSSCGKSMVLSDGDISAALKSAIKKYSSDKWTDRLAAVKGVNKVILNSNQNTFFTQKKSKPYVQIAEDFLIEASNDVQPAVRIEAITGLAAASTKAALDRLRTMADEDSESTVKWSALKALAYNPDPQSAETFAKAYVSEDWLIRETAIAGLLGIESVDVKKKYISVIKRALVDKNISVRIAALSRLNFTDQRLYKIIVQNLTEKPYNLRHTKAVLMALNGYRLEDAVRNKIIKEYLTHNDKEIRLLALKVLKTEKALSRLKK